MRYNPTERLGIIETDKIFTKEFEWIFRELTVIDVGIDALIEESVNGNPTGKLLAAQIKTGLGNFFINEKHLVLYVTQIHYNYWLNFDLPVILLAYIPEDENVYWQLISKENLVKTKKQWKLEIPKSKVLGKNSKDELLSILYGQSQNSFLSRYNEGKISETELLAIAADSKFLKDTKDSLERLFEIGTKFIEGQDKFNKSLNYFSINGFSKTHPQLKQCIKQFSKVLNLTAESFNEEIGHFSESFAKGFNSFEKLALIDFQITDDYTNLQTNSERLVNFISKINPAIEEMKNFRNTISSFHHPLLKEAKKNLIETLNIMILEFKTAKEMSSNFNNTLNEILN
ncbi:MAG: DUF4365 domain-containing protein [Acidobacteria bacterium]|nr:DUF4365 domain-containing protein [Acidobacteriota bacterium]